MAEHYTKTIVCLANSRKAPSGRCIAGRELTGSGWGGWVRPVSARPTQEITLAERRYEDGRDPSLLEMVTIAMQRPQPRRHQQENHLFDAGQCWTKQGVMHWPELQSAVEDPAGPLWLNGHSSHQGLNDRVPETSLDGFSRSLYLIRPERLRLAFAWEQGDFVRPRRRVRARFDLCGHAYSLSVTDPFVEGEFPAREDGEYAIREALMCVSLGEVIGDYAYKLAASVITPLRAGGLTKPKTMYTIGHSNHALEKFIELLKGHEITAVADVRSHPYSRYNPQFNRESLRAELKSAGLAYVFLGRELGARSETADCYVDGKVQFDRIAATPLFQEGLGRLVQGAGAHRIALLCAEKDPLTCHRAILVCRRLTAQGIGVHHILEDGRLESHDDALARLLTELGLDERDMFRTREEVIEDAYDRRGGQIAYSQQVSDEEPAERL